MNGKIKFFHPEETFVYNIDKSFCKVVYLKQKNCLVIEIESTEDLDHLEEDSLQNEFPKVILNIDDFPIAANHKDQLAGNAYEIPESTVEEEDEDGEIEEIYYTNLSVNEEDFELNENRVSFSKNQEGILNLQWNGIVDDFTEKTEESIPFEVKCPLVQKAIEIREDFEE